MLNKECDARFIGYGAMVAESLVAVAFSDRGLLSVSGGLFRN